MNTTCPECKRLMPITAITPDGKCPYCESTHSAQMLGGVLLLLMTTVLAGLIVWGLRSL